MQANSNMRQIVTVATDQWPRAGLSVNNENEVTAVAPASPAEVAGFTPGMRIVSFTAWEAREPGESSEKEWVTVSTVAHPAMLNIRVKREQPFVPGDAVDAKINVVREEWERIKATPTKNCSCGHC
ncbi:hypothetical protein Poli38472_012008 [Pythium oligandrum]|uniref:Uncharacterized protein n=1 Tax=Pythium oligandrum TaxID=41045 RepID=A0A8K1CNN1_PYTOL|nr:hypothetical protein Poli38472_012008 [Pythium oligandrum]|eukprot:TMW66892.1 hypothetical protein Poli38472_012008 [Pythium oligandrum]